ncbi:MAG TPA: O-antigen ligase family protein [Gaiellaceae bacterium]|nr:O-antigen ligase family protein [Gaiellaceae bacterium]
MRALLGGAERGPVYAAGFVFGALAMLTAMVLSGSAATELAPLVAIAVVLVIAYKRLLTWPALISGLVLVILFIPIKRYSLPGGLPFELEPYRIYVAVVATMWLAALLVDPRVRLRASGFEWPLFLFVAAALGSVIFNGARITELDVHTEVTKQLTFFASFLLVFYLIVSVVRTREHVDRIVRMLVGGGAVVAALSIVESWTGYNAFDHLDGVLPLLQHVDAPESSERGGKLRVMGSAQGSIALGAALAMMLPLAAYLGLRTRRWFWWASVGVLALGALATLSRTSILMLIVSIVVLFWLRPKQVRRFWPVLLPAVVVVQLLLPGTMGTIRSSFFPKEGLLAQQSENAGSRGSGRIADLGPALDEFSLTPVFGQGYGTRLTGRDRQNAQILDDQWLKTLLETGLVGALAWLWIFSRSIRRLARAAKEDQSPDGLLFVALAASITAFAIGMVLFDAFAFIQVTFILFIFLALGSVALTARDRASKPA